MANTQPLPSPGNPEDTPETVPLSLALPQRSLSRVLLVEDDSQQAEIFIKALKRLAAQISVVWVKTLGEAIEQLRISQEIPTIEPIDAVVLDLSLPDCGSDELLNRMSEFESHPTLVFTGDHSHLTAWRIGYSLAGFVPKDVPFHSLVQMLAHQLGAFERRQELNGEIDRLEQLLSESEG